MSTVLCCYHAVGAELPKQTGFPWRVAESNELHVNLVDSLARKLGMAPTTSTLSKGRFLSYSGKIELLSPLPLSFQFHAAVTNPSTDSFPTRRSDTTLSYYGFRTSGLTTSNNGFHKFLESAYRQEIEPEYASGMDSVVYDTKDIAVFRRRLWLSQGYAWQSIAQNNVFSGPTAWLWASHGYFIDACAGVIAVALVGRAVAGQNDLGFYAVGATTGIGVIALNRLIVVPLGTSYVNNYNRIVKSGYRIPKM